MIYDDFGAASWAAVIKESRAKHNRPEPEQPEGLTTNETPGKLVPKKPPPPSIFDCPGNV